MGSKENLAGGERSLNTVQGHLDILDVVSSLQHCVITALTTDKQRTVNTIQESSSSSDVTASVVIISSSSSSNSSRLSVCLIITTE